VVECDLAKVDVEGSNPFSRSTESLTKAVGYVPAVFVLCAVHTPMHTPMHTPVARPNRLYLPAPWACLNPARDTTRAKLCRISSAFTVE
jgi:hypothetical protein